MYVRADPRTSAAGDVASNKQTTPSSHWIWISQTNHPSPRQANHALLPLDLNLPNQPPLAESLVHATGDKKAFGVTEAALLVARGATRALDLSRVEVVVCVRPF